MKEIKDAYGFTPEDVRAWVEDAHRASRRRSKALHKSRLDCLRTTITQEGDRMTDAQSTGDDQLPRTPDRQADRRARTRARWVRWVVLGVVLVAMTAIVLAHQQSRGAGRWAGVDFLCPFGGLETLYSLLSGNGFLRHSAASAVILLIGMLAMAVAFRRSFCGMLCPLGTLQGIFGAAGRRLFGAHRLTVPPRRRPRRALPQVRRVRLLPAVDLAGGRARHAPLRPVGGLGAPHRQRPAHHLPHRLRHPRRLARRVARLRALLLQVPLPRRGPARAPVEGELPEHQARRRRPASTAAAATRPA